MAALPEVPRWSLPSTSKRRGSTMESTALGSSLLRLSRAPLLSEREAQSIHELAKRILQEIGLEILHDRARQRLVGAGFPTRDGRVLFEPAMVDEYVDAMRRRLSTEPPAPPTSDNGRLGLTVSSYPLRVHDLETGVILPYTTSRLIEMCKVVDSLADDGVDGPPPGIPVDVHPDLQPLAQYRVAALYARQGASPADPTSARTVHHLLDMADAMGHPVRSLPVYLPTPLRLGGESLAVVLACHQRLDRVSVSSMPSTGATAPIQPFGALGLAAAELIGGLIAVRVLTGKPVTFAVGIYPFNLRTGSMVFGSPENLLFGMLCADLNRFYGWQETSTAGGILAMAKLPGSQPAAEKAASMVFAASLGARRFGGAGTLSLDEVFSAEQLLVDCEIRDWVERLIQNVSLGEDAVADWLDEIRAGVQQSFMGLDSTLDAYKQYMWYPQRFDQARFGAWIGRGQQQLSQRLKNEVRERIAAHTFELDRDRRMAIERIYRAAEIAVQ